MQGGDVGTRRYYATNHASSGRTQRRWLTISGWFTTFLVGMALTYVFFGLMMLLERYIVKRMRTEREEERRRRRSFEWMDES